MSTPPLPRWLQRSRRWQRFLALLLVVALCHPIANAKAQDISISNEATATYVASNGSVSAVSNRIVIDTSPAFVDPAGKVLGCDGQPLSSYDGFFMALYEPDASGLGLGNLVALTPTSGAVSLPPNTANLNPFPLSADRGRYNFLLDSSQPLASTINAGLRQTDTGARYILVIDPPENSPFSDRRVLVEILGTVKDAAIQQTVLSYRARALDGQPIAAAGSPQVTNTVEIRNAELQPLTFFDFELGTAICQVDQISITKSADRSAAQPGDTVAYRLNVKNVATVAVDSVVAIDTLPTGFEFVTGSATGQIEGSPVAVTATVTGNNVSFSAAGTLGAQQALDILYAVRITSDALRGSGRNTAMVVARRTDSSFRVQAGPSTHRITLDQGIFSDCGTLIGRVFEDKNFDGEQQSGEAGIPNAVIFLDDGNRVVTDADGLFSVQKMLPGQRTGTLDIGSLPGYTLAPNLYFNERNSQSRLVNLAPGGLVRMNFGVTPTFQEEQG